MGDTVTLDAQNPGATYLWNTGDTTATISVTTSGTYYVTATNTAGLGRDTIVVTFNPSPTVNLGNDTAICTGMAIDVTLNAQNPGASCLWNNGSTGQLLNVTTAGSYYVSVTNSYLCKGTDTIQVSIAALPVVDLGNDTAFCASVSLTLDAQNAGATYLWSNASTTQTISVHTSGIYGVEVTDMNGCKASDTIQVTANPSPVVNLGNDVTTSAASYTIDAGNAGSAYLWNTGATTQTITVTANGIYSVTVTNVNSCSANDSIKVTLEPTGIKDINTVAHLVKVIPNPAKDIIYIRTEDDKLINQLVILTNAYGRVLRSIIIKSKSQELSLDHLAQGMYFLKIQTGEVLKFVKE